MTINESIEVKYFARPGAMFGDERARGCPRLTHTRGEGWIGGHAAAMTAKSLGICPG
jgi:hypothetical protein